MADDRQRIFTDLYETASADVWRFVRRRVSTGTDADDVTSDVFSIAWRRVDALPPDDEQRLWLFGVARNVLRNHERARFRQSRLESALTLVTKVTGLRSDGGLDRDDAVWRALACMRPTDRDVLLMRAWEELSVTEIATLLETTPNAVSVRLSKARSDLRRRLDEKDQGTSGDELYDPATQGARDG